MSAREGSAAESSVRPGCVHPGTPAPAATQSRAAGGDRAQPRIPGIVITARLGEGLRGTVYAGFRGSGRVAVKVLRKGATLDRAVLERFIRDRGGAPGAEAISHPNLLPVHEIGETESGALYYTMPLLRGDSLETLIDDLKRGSSERPSLNAFSVGPGGETHPQLPRRAAEVLADSAEGLGEAHRLGVIHRRLSPRNLIFTPAGRLLVTDFGGAPSAGSLDGLARVAPEELAPDAGPPGPASDVYSLGAILYEVFTRRLPYDAPTPHELRKAIGKGRFPVPRSLRSDIPAPLEAVILKALALSPRDRYAHAAELAADLRRFLRHETPVALREARALEGKPVDPAASRPAAPGHGLSLRAPGRWLAGRAPSRRILGAAGIIALCALLGLWARREESRAVVGEPGASRPAASRDAGAGSLFSLNPGGASRETPPQKETPVAESLATEARLVPPPATRRTSAGSFAAREVRPLDAPRGAGYALSAGVGEGLPEVTLDGPVFLALMDTLIGAPVDEDRRLLCRWDRDTLRAMDLAPRPASISLPPNIRLELDSGGPGSFTSRWIRAAAELDPAALLDRGILEALLEDERPGGRRPEGPESLGRREEIVRELLRAQEKLLEPDPERSLSRIAREHWVTNGMDALRALAAAGAHDALVDLARGRLPLEMREAALVFLGTDAALHRPELRELAARSPDASLRALAFRHLASEPAEDMLPEIRGALDDPALREDALAALSSFPPGSRGAARLAVELLRHPEGSVRARATSFLCRERAGPVALDLGLALLSPGRVEREAAFEVFRSSAPGDMAAALESLLVSRAPDALWALE